MQTICLNYYGFQTNSMRMTCHWGNAVVKQVGVSPYRDAIASRESCVCVLGVSWVCLGCVLEIMEIMEICVL